MRETSFARKVISSQAGPKEEQGDTGEGPCVTASPLTMRNRESVQPLASL